MFVVDGEVVRGLTDQGLREWDALADSDLLDTLLESGDIVPTTRDDESLRALRGVDRRGEWVAALRHERLPVISYPYEWPFSMLKDAALFQLRLTRDALAAGLSLKDATPYNVQWRGTKPVFVDIGSFEAARAGEPWLGYRQFCMQFLYPLLLQSYTGVPFQPLLRGALEGIRPAEMRALLAGRDVFRRGVLRHVVLHARLERDHAGARRDIRGELREAGFDKRLIEANLRGLEKLVARLEPAAARGEWVDYGATCGYTDDDTAAKEAFVRSSVSRRSPSLVWDLGCNDGRYSRVAAEGARYVVAVDADVHVVDDLYRTLRSENIRSILPLFGDVADPSPGLGWRGTERQPLIDRARPDFTLALALVHHLAISRTVPLREIVDWFASLGSDLVVEFPDRNDPMVERLLVRKRDGSHPDYRREVFEEILASRFTVGDRRTLPSGTRTMYNCSPL